MSGAVDTKLASEPVSRAAPAAKSVNDAFRADVIAIRRHIQRRFAETPLERLPFPHLTISDFFPEAVYEKILAYNLFRKNRGVDWKVRSEINTLRTPTPYDHRKQINFHTGEKHLASREEQVFWRTISYVFLGDDWFLKLVQRAYPAYFDIRFGEAMLWPGFWRKMRRELFLQRHEVGYHIGPHTDVPARVFTCIFSFADRPGFEEYGTQIMRHKDPSVRCSGRQHYGFEDFQLVKTAPYAPNNFFLFFKTRQSFHAVKTIEADVPNERYGMQFQCYEPGVGLFNDLSHPDLLAPKLIREEFLGRPPAKPAS